MSGIAALAAAAAQTSKITTLGSTAASQAGTAAGGIKVVTPSLVPQGIKVTQVPGRQRSMLLLLRGLFVNFCLPGYIVFVSF